MGIYGDQENLKRLRGEAASNSLSEAVAIAFECWNDNRDILGA